MSRRRFISLEGSEACGKSTQIERLVDTLRQRGEDVAVTREPGGTPLGEMVRKLVKHAPEGKGMCDQAELFLFAASRAQLVRQMIQPELEAGHWVVSDRFFDSTTVYQGLARGLPVEQVAAVNHLAVGETQPGLTLVLDLETEEALRRLRRRVRPVGQEDRMEAMPADFYEKVRQGYREIAEKEPERVRIVDASGSEDEVQALVWKEVAHAFCL